MNDIYLCPNISINLDLKGELELKKPKTLEVYLPYPGEIEVDLDAIILAFNKIDIKEIYLDLNTSYITGELNVLKKHLDVEVQCPIEYINKLTTLLSLNPEYKTFDIRVLYDKRHIYLPDLVVSPINSTVNKSNIGEFNYIENTQIEEKYYSDSIREALKTQSTITLEILKSAVIRSSTIKETKQWLIGLVKLEDEPAFYIFNNFWYDSSTFEDMIIINRSAYLEVINRLIELFQNLAIPHCQISKVVRDVEIKQCGYNPGFFDCEGINIDKNLSYFELILKKYLERCPK